MKIKGLLIGIILSLFLGAPLAYSQINQRVKSIYFENADSATVRTNAANCGDCGFIYYNNQDTTNAKFRVYQDSVWYDLLGGGSGASSFANGITLSAGVAKWGGSFINNTSIFGNGYNLSLGTGISRIGTFNVTSTNTTLNPSTLLTITTPTITLTTPPVAGDSNTYFLSRNYSTGHVELTVGTSHGSLLSPKLTYWDGSLLQSSSMEQTINNTVKAIPTSQYSGLNFGTLAGDPVTTNTGDVWYNTLIDGFKGKTSLGTVGIISGNLTSGRIPIGSGNSGVVDDSDLTFNTNTLTATQYTTGSANPVFISDGAILIGAGGSTGPGSTFGLSVNNHSNGTGNNLQIAGGGGGSGTGGNLILLAGTGVSSNGFIILSGLPTTCSGAPTGALANVASVLTICP